MVRRRNKAASQGVHLCQRADHTCIAVVVSVDTSCQARAGSRFHSDNFIISFTPEHLTNKRCDQTSEIGTTSRTTDNHIGLYTVFIQSRLRFKTDNRLMQHYLRQDRTQHITIGVLADSSFHCFRNRAAQTSRSPRELGVNLTPHICEHRRGRCHFCSISTHDFAPERLLLVRTLHHIYLTVQTEIGTRHGESRAPLTCSCFRRHALQPLLLRVVRLSDSRIQLMASGSIISFKFIVNVSRRIEFFFQAVRSQDGTCGRNF